jgi:hypothetical protein
MDLLAKCWDCHLHTATLGNLQILCSKWACGIDLDALLYLGLTVGNMRANDIYIYIYLYSLLQFLIRHLGSHYSWLRRHYIHFYVPLNQFEIEEAHMLNIWKTKVSRRKLKSVWAIKNTHSPLNLASIKLKTEMQWKKRKSIYGVCERVWREGAERIEYSHPLGFMLYLWLSRHWMEKRLASLLVHVMFEKTFVNLWYNLPVIYISIMVHIIRV